MYANYLVDVGKLVYIVGEIQSTCQFKKLFQGNDSLKDKIFYKCVDEVPPDTYKKTKYDTIKKGIIRIDWFSKILDKAPQMIIMVFNCTPQLTQNQVWQDRLKTIIKKINKVFDILKTNNKEDIILRIVVLISKHTFGGINLHQKITNFLKTYEKDLFIIQYELYTKQIAKIRGNWIANLQKNYQRKFKKISKKSQETFLQRRYGCLIKMAIISEMLSKKDQKQKYQDAYIALKNRFTQLTKSVNILNHYQVRQLRTVADVIILRHLKIGLKKGKPVEDVIISHLDFFRMKNMGLNQTNKYYYYEELVWRCDFLQSLFEILYANDGLQMLKPTFLAQLLNGLVAFLHALSTISQKQFQLQLSLGGKQLKHNSDIYADCISFQNDKQISQVNIIYTFIKKIHQNRKDYISKGYQLITRFKSLKIFKANQLLFLNIYLLKFYLQDGTKVFILGKSSSLITIYDEIMKLQLSRRNYYLLNDLFNQIRKQFEKVQESYKVMFYGIACLICDYFQSQNQLEDYIQHLFISIKKHNSQYFPQQQQDLLQMGDSSKKQQSSLFKPQAYSFKVKKNSHIVTVECYLENQFNFIEEEINIKLNVRVINSLLKKGATLKVIFNNPLIYYESNLNQNSKNCVLNFKINPLQHLQKDQTLYIQKIIVEMKDFNTSWVINKKQISFLKNTKLLVYTKIKCPQILLKVPYTTYFINQISKIKIQVQKQEGYQYQIDAKFLIKQQDNYGKTQLFADYQERINLINSKYYQDLVTKQNKNIHNSFWLKCNKIGQKILKLNFIITVQKQIINKKTGSSNILKNSFNFSKQIKFTIRPLFDIQKIFKQIPYNTECTNNNIPLQKKILLTFMLQANENILIKEIGQHKNPKKIEYFKQIKNYNLTMKKSQKIKFNMVFRLPEELKDQIQLFLTSLYIKWTRLPSQSDLIFGGNQTHSQNLYLDHQTKINSIAEKLSVTFTTNNHGIIYKRKVNKIVINFQNVSREKRHIFVTCDGNEHILRVGQRGKGIYLQQRSKSFLQFDVLAVNSGFLPFPFIKIYVDGIQLKGIQCVSVIKSV